MANTGDFLSRLDSSASDDLRLALDLSVTSNKSSMINFQGKSFTVKRIRPARDHAVGNGVDWSAPGKVEITAGMQTSTTRPGGCKCPRSFFPALRWDSGKREKPLRNVRNVFRRSSQVRRDSQ